MISSKTNFEHVRTIHFRAGIRNFSDDSFWSRTCSDFCCFNVGQNKMVGAKKGLQVVKTVN